MEKVKCVLPRRIFAVLRPKLIKGERRFIAFPFSVEPDTALGEATRFLRQLYPGAPPISSVERKEKRIKRGVFLFLLHCRAVDYIMKAKRTIDGL